MDYRKFGETYYIRLDRGDEIISSILGICQKEQIESAIFSGIGGCRSAEIQTFIPETGSFEVQKLKGMLELVSLTGNAPISITPTRLFLIKKMANITLRQGISSRLKFCTRLKSNSGPSLAEEFSGNMIRKQEPDFGISVKKILQL